MKLSKSLFKVGVASCVLWLNTVSAGNSIAGLDDDSPLAINANLIAAQIGSTPEQYLEAVARFGEMAQIRTASQPTPINERPLYKQLQSALISEKPLCEDEKAKSIKLDNQVQADFASYLGLSVSQYAGFMDVINALDFHGAYKNIEFAGLPNINNNEIVLSEVEREIQVLCDAECQVALSDPNRYHIRNIIFAKAINAEIPQTVNMWSYVPFKVHFVDLKGGNVATQIWVYNHKNGAWRDGSSVAEI
ncbi:hypothetical protein [Planctobacterium marinum]|uniref:Uncharacterized protein n=1 Tax=Planctobacterium marinum TaxID=1631968 RepID=A0AA48KSU3_9ALTE|nr:hypothetical protein MACH26_23650 [Planctobacterium marinum]